MDEKYTTTRDYAAAIARRAPVRAAFRAMMPNWSRPPATADGYSAVIGCNHELIPVLRANLRVLSKASLPSLQATIVVFDCAASDNTRVAAAELQAQYPELRLEFVNYSRVQQRVADRLRLPWFYCCLSWCLGLDQVNTKYAVLHDLDAMLLAPDLLESRFDIIRDEQLTWLGDEYYAWNGMAAEDEVVTTWEMFIDIADVKSRYKPVDLMQRVGKVNGRRADFDITLHAQALDRNSAIAPIGQKNFVHPEQVIHQYTEMKRLGRLPALPRIGALFIPYFCNVGGQEGILEDFVVEAQGARAEALPLLGFAVDTTAMTQDYYEGIIEKVDRLEHFLFGERRPIADDYLAAIAAVVAV